MKNHPLGSDVYDLGPRYTRVYHGVPLVSWEARDSVSEMADRILDDIWYPQSAHDIELIVLRKIYELAGAKDSCVVSLDNQFVIGMFKRVGYGLNTYLYLTAEMPFLKDFGNDLLVTPEEIGACGLRAKERHIDFKNRHLVLGDGEKSIGLTFQGRAYMEDLLSRTEKEDVLDRISNDLVSLVASVDRCEAELSDVNERLQGLVEKTDRSLRFDVKDCLQTVSGVCTICSTVLTGVSVSEKLSAGLQNVVTFVRSVLNSYGR